MINTNTTTKSKNKRRKPQTTTGLLRLILALGAVISTLIGADLLATKDQAPTTMTTESGATVVVVVPEIPNDTFQGIDFSSLPNLNIPQPFAQSKSSG